MMEENRVVPTSTSRRPANGGAEGVTIPAGDKKGREHDEVEAAADAEVLL